MRKIAIIPILFLLTISVFAQNNPIHSLTLENGLQVVLCEDHSQPQIYGAVCVHVGSKNDPEDNTGMAHYLEHLMFKGTNRIGTLDWESEKVFLDSIDLLYDKLHDITDEKQRNTILLQINQLSNKATAFAIPNEVDVILDRMGSQGVNAFTSNDVTVYHNMFPSNQLEKWLTVYTERFRMPVFRLFQSELEAVYEEYNMYQDNPWMSFMESALAEAYGPHPYGRPVIGYQQHLKNPQTSAMRKFYCNYYHPSNMTLVMVGDFDAAQILPLLKKTMGQLHNESDGVNVVRSFNSTRMNTDLNKAVAEPEGHRIVTKKETPVKVGVVGFHTVGASHRDALVLEMIGDILNNEASTGLLDHLNSNNDLLMSQAINYPMLEDGVFAFAYVPKILGQSHEQAEELVFAVIDSLRKGHFSNDLFEAVKMEYLTDYLTEQETIEGKFDIILDLVMNKCDLAEYEKQAERIRRLTKEDVTRVANRYFGDNCLIYRSDVGFKSHQKLQKPSWEPVVAQNTDVQSAFAKEIEGMPVSDVKSQQIEFNELVYKAELTPDYSFYGARNPDNEIFTLTVAYNYGTFSDVKLEAATDYFNLQGALGMPFDKFQLALQRMGASMDVETTTDRTYITITGFDHDMPEILDLCHKKIAAPSNDEKSLETLINAEHSEVQMQKNDASTWGEALFYYAMYGENSPFLRKLTLNDLKKVSGKELLNSFANIFHYDGYVTYVGTRDFEDVCALVRNVYGLSDKVEKGKRELPQLRTYSKPTILLASNGRFLQSNIYFYMMGTTLEQEKERMRCKAYNEYMSGSMAGVIFQEIRELRSLGYSAYGGYKYDQLSRRPGFLYGYLGTQADKTVDGCSAMGDLLAIFPDKRDKFENARTSAIKQMESSHVHFRDYPQVVASWEEQGYQQDPRQNQIAMMREMSFEEVRDFHNSTVGKSPLVITIAGDKRQINLKELSRKYQIITVKYKDILR